MFEIRVIEWFCNWLYARRRRRCERAGHARRIAERCGRVDGVYVIEQRVECGRCSLGLSPWMVVLAESSLEELWEQVWPKKSA